MKKKNLSGKIYKLLKRQIRNKIEIKDKIFEVKFTEWT